MLTQLQRDAIAQAQAGDFSLADAMELDCQERRTFYGYDLIGGIAIGGRLRQLVYGEPITCTDCYGEGGLDCDECVGGELTCSDCDGEGTLECTDCSGKGCDACTNGEKECAECKGTGDVDCQDCAGTGKRDCSGCDGLGERLDSNGGGCLLVDLNGRILADCDNDPDEWDAQVGQVNRTRGWATKVLHEYHNPPKPPATAETSATQGVLIPEVAAA